MLKGSESPRLFTPEGREITEETSLGYAFAEWCEVVCHVTLLPWQKWLAVHGMEIEGDFENGWNFRFRTVLVLVARQNGKTLFAELLALFFMYVLGVDMILGTAQNVDTAEEVWDSAINRAEESPYMRERIDHVRRVNGGKSFELKSGEKYKVVAATRQGARGKRADLVLMDELREQRNWDGWGAVSKTMMARPNAMLWAFSNAGDSGSEVLRHLRATALVDIGDPDGTAEKVLQALPEASEPDDSLAIFEWSARPNCDLGDREGWAQANPSLGYGFMSERAIKSAMKTDPENVFRTECLCQWVEAAVPSPFPDDAWMSGQDQSSHEAPDAEYFWGIDISADRSKTALAFVSRKQDGSWHGEVEAYRPGFDWIIPLLSKAAAIKPMRIAVQGRGAAVSSHIDELSLISGVEIVSCEGRDLGAWAGRFYDAICAKPGELYKLWHIPQPDLDNAASVAQVRPLGDSAWCWDRRNSGTDISPLVALTMAYGLATAVVPETRVQSAYSDGHSLVFI